jgi:hypothetical protein
MSSHTADRAGGPGRGLMLGCPASIGLSDTGDFTSSISPASWRRELTVGESSARGKRLRRYAADQLRNGPGLPADSPWTGKSECGTFAR